MNDEHLETSWVGKTPEECCEHKAIAVDRCNDCGEDIYEGQEYYDFNGTIICKDCFAKYYNKYEQ